MLPHARWSHRLLATTVVAITTLSGIALAQDAVATARARAGELLAVGQLAEAAAVWETARAEAEAAGDAQAVARCEFHLGMLLADQERFAAALPHYESALASFQTLHDRYGNREDGMGVVLCLERLGHCLMGLERHELARQKFESALDVAGRVIEGDSDRMATLLYGAGVCLVKLGRYDLALPRHESGLAMSMRLHGDDHPTIALGLDHVANCLSELGRCDEALPMLERALAMAVRLHGADHHAVIAGLMHRAQCLEDLGRYDDALKDHQAATAMARRVLGEDHEDTGKVIANLAACLTTLGRYDEAARHFEEALAMNRRLHAGDHPNTALCLHNIGNCLHGLGQDGLALTRYESSLAMAKRVYEPSHPFLATSLRSLGNHLRVMGRVAEGLPKLEASLAMLQRLHTGDDREIVKGLSALASGLRAIGRNAEALAMAEAAVAMRRRLSPRDSVQLSDDLAGVAECLVWLGRYDEALVTAQSALDMLRRLFPSGHPVILDRLNTVANCQAQLDPHQALATAEEALAMSRRAHVGDDPAVALSLANTAYLLHLDGRSKEAIPRAEAALAMCRRLGPIGNQQLVASLLSLLAMLRLDGEGDTEASVRLLDEAIVEVEDLRHSARALSSEDRTSYFSHLKLRSDVYGRMRRAQVRLGSPRSALAYTERGRARSMLDLLAGGQFDALAEAERRATAQGDTQGAARVRAAKAGLEAAEAQLGNTHHEMAKLAADQSLAGDARTARRAQLEAEARTAHARREQAVRERAQVVADVEAIGEPASTEQIQATLTEGELLLVWALDAKESHLFVVAPTGPIDVVPISATRGSAAQAVEGLRFGLISAQERLALADAGKGRAPVDARALAQTFLPEAVWQQVRQARRVFVVPDGALHRLPLEVLVVGEHDGEPRRWIEDGPPIAYVASGSVLRWLRLREKAQRDAPCEFDLLAAGDPVFTGTDAERLPDSGALIDTVVAGSQAEHVGLRRGDVLLAYDGQTLADAAALRPAIDAVDQAVARGARSAAAVSLRVLRDGKEIEVAAVPGLLGIHTGRGTARAAWQSGYAQSVDEQLLSSRHNGGLGPFDKLDRLPGTRGEVEAIAAALRRQGAPERVHLLLGADASEAKVFALAGKARYLHFATDGLSHESETASLSALALSSPQVPSMIDDGFLKLTDLLARWGQRLPSCRMVVLSACRTQVGPQVRDEAPYALPLGFLYAGASSVVATQWMVPDNTTAKLMADFYARVRAQGAQPDRLAALTAAKKALREEYPNPYYWAAFVYLGSPE